MFRNLTWKDYLAVLSAIGDDRAAKLTYDQGRLEITMPLQAHEFASEMIALFIRILVEELEMELKSIGSTTLSYPDLDRGAEPDKGFYIQNQPVVAGRDIDFEKDPPPDLVVEIDITNTDIDKLTLYAAMGIPEFWRFDGKTLRIYMLQNESYTETVTSSAFSTIPNGKLSEFLTESKQSEVRASRNLRKWIQENY